MHEKYSKDGLHIIAVNLDKDQSSANEFLSQFLINFEILFDPQATLAEGFGVAGMPSSFLINREGKLVTQHIGFNAEDKPELEAAIRYALNQ